MKRLLTLPLLLAFSLNLYAYTKGKVYKLTILHTNDHHGRFWPNRDGEFGLAARATLINQLRKEIKDAGGHVLLLDAGDVNTGVPQSDMLDAEPDFKGMGLIGYDVMAVGNHEFDRPLATIFKQEEWAGFPFISANIYYQESNERVFRSHITKELEDLKVTIFGLTTEDTPLKSNPNNSKGLKFIPAVAEAKKLVPTLRPSTDVLIALTHMGHYPDENHRADAPGDVTLARQVNGIDVIVGGHTEKPLFKPDVQNGTVIVQAENWGKYVGRVDFEFLDGKLTLKNYQLIPVNLKESPHRIAADAYLEAFLQPFKEKGDATLQVEIGQAEVEFIGRRDVVRSQETNLGNLVTRAFQTKFQADLAILNSGGLRDSIYQGKVTYESVLMVLPFGGEVVTAELSGKELKAYLEFVVFNQNPGSGSFPQMSNITIKGNLESKTITELRVGGKKVCPSKKYLIALPEFIAGGGDKYPALSFRKYGHVDAEVLREFILGQGVLRAQDFMPTGYIQLK
jgi:5'-nucleotidase / UDP-sugar diphosphatase